jgi:hypothetical protein
MAVERSSSKLLGLVEEEMSYVVVGRRPSEPSLRRLRSCSSREDAQLHEQRYRDQGYVECSIERASIPGRLKSGARDTRRRYN